MTHDLEHLQQQEMPFI